MSENMQSVLILNRKRKQDSPEPEPEPDFKKVRTSVEEMVCDIEEGRAPEIVPNGEELYAKWYRVEKTIYDLVLKYPEIVIPEGEADLIEKVWCFVRIMKQDLYFKQKDTHATIADEDIEHAIETVKMTLSNVMLLLPEELRSHLCVDDRMVVASHVLCPIDLKKDQHGLTENPKVDLENELNRQEIYNRLYHQIYEL